LGYNNKKVLGLKLQLELIANFKSKDGLSRSFIIHYLQYINRVQGNSSNAHQKRNHYIGSGRETGDFEVTFLPKRRAGERELPTHVVTHAKPFNRHGAVEWSTACVCSKKLLQEQRQF
jgi:hypothetical protein